MNKQPKCKHCGERFTPVRSTLERYCLKKECVAAWIDKAKTYTKRKEKKDWKVQKKKMKESLKTKSEWVKETQVVFNSYIRQRDVNQPCISCGSKLTGKFDAGHYFPAGSYPMLRFEEDNCHGQCVHCNQHRHGNLPEYKIGLIGRIGQARFDLLEKNRLIEKHYTIPELIVLKEIYKEKLRQMIL